MYYKLLCNGGGLDVIRRLPSETFSAKRKIYFNLHAVRKPLVLCHILSVIHHFPGGSAWGGVQQGTKKVPLKKRR